MNSDMNNNGRKASEAKIRGNRVHNHLKILALRWVKRNRPVVARKLKAQAQKEMARG